MSFGIPRHELADYYDHADLEESEAAAERDAIARDERRTSPAAPTRETEVSRGS